MEGLELPYGISPLNPVFVDARMGPFSGSNEATAKASALGNIPEGVRVKGLQVVLYIAGSTKIYWFKDSILDAGLVPYAEAGGGSPTTDASLLTSGTLNAARLPTIPQSLVTNLPTDLASKANSVSPTFTGVVTLPANTSIGPISSAEIGTLDGVTSSIQTQINSKEPTVTPGTTGQYYRGDKTWQTLPTGSTPTTDASQLTTGTLNADRLPTIPQNKIASLSTDLAGKQPLLVSGTNIKTVNGQSLLDGGDLVIQPTPPTTDASQLTTGTLNQARLPAIPQNIVTGLSTSLAGKQATLVSGTNIRTINGQSLLGGSDLVISGGSGSNDASTLTTGTLSDARLSANVMLTSKYRLFNVLDYGAIGNDVADDTAAFQATINACRIVGGTMVIPSPTVAFRITDTLNIVPVLSGQPGYIAGNEVYMDIEAHGRPETHIRYYGAANKAVFFLKGWRFGSCKGLKVKIVDGNQARTDRTTRAGVTCFDLDTDNPSYSTTHLTFKDCHCFLGSGTDTTGWRLGRGVGHQNGWGADISNIQWENCSVWGNYQDTTSGSIGWLIEGANTLQNTWMGGFGAFLDRMFSNKNRAGAGNGPGNGGCYFFGLGSSHNNIEYEVHNSQSYLISGGRYEVGKRFISVTNGNNAPSITVQGAELNDFIPTDGVLVWIDRPCSLILSNVNVLGGVIRSTAYDNTAITLYGGGEGAGVGTCIIDGGSWMASDPFYRFDLNATKWQVHVRGVGRLGTGVNAGVRVGWMKNMDPRISPNGTKYNVSVNDAGQVIATAL